MSQPSVSASLGHRHEHAIEHPIRVQILTELGERPLLSPLDMSSSLRLPLRRVTYHFRRLQLLGVIELARRTTHADGEERHYQLAPDAAVRALAHRARRDNTPDAPRSVR